MRIQDSYTVPEKTAEVARVVFPNGNNYLTLFDSFGSLFADPEFAALLPDHGQLALSPVHLMLIQILQLMEGLSDRQAADAVRSRIDWKYAHRAGIECTISLGVRTSTYAVVATWV